MTDRPILFSAPMVRALLDGRKTQTRRVLNPQPYPLEGHSGYWNASGVVGGRIVCSDAALARLHRFAVGDRLWVREAHYLTDDGDHEHAVYAADKEDVRTHLALIGALPASFPEDVRKRHKRRRPGIHMPRWASRLTLHVTDVRVQRLQEISEADAIAEGAEVCRLPGMDGGIMVHTENPGVTVSPGRWYRQLWNSINATRGHGWNANPWVVAVTFTVERRNIDEARP